LTDIDIDNQTLMVSDFRDIVCLHTMICWKILLLDVHS